MMSPRGIAQNCDIKLEFGFALTTGLDELERTESPRGSGQNCNRALGFGFAPPTGLFRWEKDEDIAPWFRVKLQRKVGFRFYPSHGSIPLGKRRRHSPVV